MSSYPECFARGAATSKGEGGMDDVVTFPPCSQGMVQVARETTCAPAPRLRPRERGHAMRDGLPYVGRGREFRHLMQRLRAARQGQGQVVVISGPAGIGKTRLAEEFASRAHHRGATVALGQCWREGDAPPLWPWRMVLRDLGAPAELLADPPSDGAHGRFARFVAVLDYLRAGSRSTTHVILLDDVQVADTATLLLTRFLARERRRLRLVLLLTCRDEPQGHAGEGHALLTELAREATTIPLAGLSAAAVGAYLAAGGRPALDPELVSAVSAITQGNPLHLRSLLQHGAFGAHAALGGLEPTITGLLEQLASPDRRLVGLAALLGMDVSVYEVARLAQTSTVVATEALGCAAALGLMVERPDLRVRFVHACVHKVAGASLPLHARLDAHAHAVTLVAGSAPEHLLRRAHHAFEAASRSPADALLAVQIARETAVALQAVDGFEPAAALLGRAVALHEGATLPGPTAALVLAWAEAVLACGRLAEARPLFARAARLGEAEGDPWILARAALGLGGVWVREHRLLAEAEQVLVLQRRALEALPPAATTLRTRLTVRLAAEAAYRGGPLLPVLQGVEAARHTQDAQVLAEALSLYHHALLTPEQTWNRLDIATQLITAAATAREGFLLLVGLCWRAADLFLLGDPTAHAALAELRRRADAVRCQSVLFIVQAMDVMLAIRAGQFSRAEEAATACFDYGTAVGDVDALAYYGAHLAAIRVFQGREAELTALAASIATSPTLLERERAFAYAAALFALRAGDPQPAQAVLEELQRRGLGAVPPSSSWLIALLAIIELATALEDERIAQAAYEALAPYAELPLMGSLATVCFGSVHRPLGVAALTAGHCDRALAHFRAAVAANVRLGHRPAAIQARAELALALLHRASASDVPRGQVLLQEAIVEADTLGMTGLSTRWQATLGMLEGKRRHESGEALHITPAPHGGWCVAFGQQIATVPDLVGMHYLARLVAAPNQEIPALALVADKATSAQSLSTHAVLDTEAVTGLRQRIGALRQAPLLTDSEAEELDALTHALARALGLGGRSRTFADVPERARTAVRKALKRAVEQITTAHPMVGQHLAERLETGAVCCYRGSVLPTAGGGARLPDAVYG